MRAIHLFFRLHCPYELKSLEEGSHEYFAGEADFREADRKSYQPLFALLERNTQKYPDLKVTLAISGPWLEQAERFDAELVERVRKLANLGRIEIVAEPYYHSLASFYNKDEFMAQVKKCTERLYTVFNVEPKTFCMPELIYHDRLAKWAESAGFSVMLAGDAGSVLDWYSPNRVYEAAGCENLRVLFENMWLSRSIMNAHELAMVEGLKASEDFAELAAEEQEEVETPKTTRKATAAEFVKGMTGALGKKPGSAKKVTRKRLETSGKMVFSAKKFQKQLELECLRGNLVNLYLDAGIFGAFRDDGIISFFDELIGGWLKVPGDRFVTAQEAAELLAPTAEISVKTTVSWRPVAEMTDQKGLVQLKDVQYCPPDWLRAVPQVKAENALYALRERVVACEDDDLNRDFGRLTAVDYVMMMDVTLPKLVGKSAPAKKSAGKAIYENFMAVLDDFEARLVDVEAMKRPKLTETASKARSDETEASIVSQVEVKVEKKKSEPVAEVREDEDEDDYTVKVHRVQNHDTEAAEDEMSEWQAGAMTEDVDDDGWGDEGYWDEILAGDDEDELESDAVDDAEAEVQVMAQRMSRLSKEKKREIETLEEAELVMVNERKKKSAKVKQIMKKIVIE